MEWLLIFALCVWAFVQSQRIDRLSRQLEELAERGRPEGSRADPARPSERREPPLVHQMAVRTSRPAPWEKAAPQPEPSGLPVESGPRPTGAEAKPAGDRPDAPDPLPTTEGRSAAPADRDEAVASSHGRPASSPTLESRPPPLVLATARDASPRPDADAGASGDSRSLETWLSERGLAWIGAGALALGGVFLVAYAAQQGFFTPLMRLIAAMALGATLIGASEFVRRAGRRSGGNYVLIAALLAGAGAGTLYAVSWGAYGLYNYIDWRVAAMALAACCALLLGLSLLHGEALGVLAIVAAFLAPLLTGKGAWPQDALTLYLALVGLAGFATAAFKRWIWVAAATVLSAYVWFAVSLGDGVMRPLLLLCLAAAGGCAFAFRPHADEETEEGWRTGAPGFLASASIAASSLFALRHWAEIALSREASMLFAPALAGIALLALAALAVRARLIAPIALIASIAALPIGFLIYRLLNPASPGADYYAWALASAAAVELASLAASLRATVNRGLIAGAGALGGLALLVIAALSQPVWNSPPVWAPLALGAALAMAAAHLSSRNAKNERADGAVDCWAGAAAGAWLLALESAIPVEWKPLADAAAAALFVFMFVLRPWRILQSAALVAAAASLAHAFSPAFTGAVLTGGLNLWIALFVLATSAIALFSASALARRENENKAAHETLSSAAIVALLLGAFLFLRWIASGGAGVGLDEYLENSLSALTLIAAGFVEIPRRGQNVGLIARVRGHALLGAGLVFIVFAQVFDINPWWGIHPAELPGPPLLNANALAFAAPAAMALLAAARFYGRVRAVARVYAVIGGALALVWIALEIRHAFHGAALAQGPVGLVEGCAYGVAALLGALAVAITARMRSAAITGERPLTDDLIYAEGAVTIGAAIVGAFILCIVRNAWWGIQDGGATRDVEAFIAVFAHLIAAAICVVLARVQPGDAQAARHVACGAAALFGFVFGLLGIRWLHHGGAMDDGAPLRGLEAFGYALWPLIFASAGAFAVEHVARRERWRDVAHSLRGIFSSLLWLALAFSVLALWLVFPPWWGMAPVRAGAWGAAAIGLVAYLVAAGLSAWSTRLQGVRENETYALLAKISCVGHLLVAATLTVRRAFHGADMEGGVSNVEIWAYSAVWALFGAIVVGLGTSRRDTILRWLGLTVLLATTAKVFLIDMRDLEGVIRAASFLALGGVLVLVALASRRFGRTASAPVAEGTVSNGGG